MCVKKIFWIILPHKVFWMSIGYVRGSAIKGLIPPVWCSFKGLSFPENMKSGLLRIESRAYYALLRV